MTPERWQQIEQILAAAMPLAPGERDAFLAQACGSDENLRHEVESLLHFQPNLETFLEAPPAAIAADLLATEQIERAGQMINHYQILQAIGHGGMGEVYQARDTRLGRHVALKMLPVRFTQDPDRVRRFQREARTASALNHPNILTIYEISQHENTQFIAAEFVEGRTLRTLLINNELDLGMALEITIQVASALAAAHQAGVIHRDIRPEKIMLVPDPLLPDGERSKLLDFALAKLKNPAQVPGAEQVETRGNLPLLSGGYRAPEQDIDEDPSDVRLDVYLLGLLIREMLGGRAEREPAAGLPAGVDRGVPADDHGARAGGARDRPGRAGAGVAADRRTARPAGRPGAAAPRRRDLSTLWRGVQGAAALHGDLRRLPLLIRARFRARFRARARARLRARLRARARASPFGRAVSTRHQSTNTPTASFS